MDREDIESRRAENQFWNGAENYQLRADFQMYRPDGEADLYFNTIIGLVYRLYDYERLRPLFNTFQSQTSGAFYTDLFWLGLEGVSGRCWRICGGSTPSRRRPSPGSPPSVRASTTCAGCGSGGPWGTLPRRIPGRRGCWTT